MAEPQKQTIYIDVDDEITSIVEKVRDADHKIVALVLPKRMATLQSIVNMKLLKRTADSANKKIVLITSEASLLPLAGAVKIHVAKTLQSKPAIPAPPDVGNSKEIVADDTGEDADGVDKSKSVGELAGATAVVAAAKKDDIDEDTIDIDSIDDEPAPKDKGKTKAKANKLKVPNFEKFRTKLMLAAGGLALLIVLLMIANKVLPHAKVVIKTNSVEVNTNLTITADTQAKELNEEEGIMPATKLDITASSTQQVTASGKKNVGEKATGTMTVYNCSSSVQNLPAGTTFSNGAQSFLSDKAITVSKSGYSLTPSGFVCNKDGNTEVGVIASQAGSKYNVNSGNYTTGINNVTGSGSEMTGGTDKTINVLSQADIDTAKQKASQDSEGAKNDLVAKFKEQNLYALPPTIKPHEQTVDSSAKVGDEASNVSVTVKTKYTMLGVKQEDLEKLIDNNAKDQIDIQKQKISDYGLGNASIVINSTKSTDNQTMSFQTTAIAGASIDTEALKQDMAGKKKGDVKAMVSSMPSVQDVNVLYSPFWVTKAPSNPAKINIEVQNQQAEKNE